MKKFIHKSLLFSIPIWGWFVFVIIQMDGYSDAFYLRLTSPKQSSMILGTSRAAQGIHPHIINKILDRNDVYNYAFTSEHSPFGPTYLTSIKKKTNPNTTNGIFIIEVNPWSLSSKAENPNDTTLFRENKRLLNTSYVATQPNIPYLIKNNHFTKFPLKQKEAFLHGNGWLEITIEMDSMSVEKRTKNRIDGYKNHTAKRYQFSETRLHYLSKTISFLQQYGEVYLVRLPIHQKIIEIENEYMPNFNQKIQMLASTKKLAYLDFTLRPNTYIFVDGNHLYTASGESVSNKIANWIYQLNE